MLWEPGQGCGLQGPGVGVACMHHSCHGRLSHGSAVCLEMTRDNCDMLGHLHTCCLIVGHTLELCVEVPPTKEIFFPDHIISVFKHQKNIKKKICNCLKLCNEEKTVFST